MQLNLNLINRFYLLKTKILYMNILVFIQLAKIE